MKKNLYFLTVSILTLALVVVVPFLFDNQMSDKFLATYLTAKILFGLLFVGSVVYCFVKDTARSVTLSLITISALYQLLPLAIRGIFKLESNQIVISVIVLLVALIVYVALLGGISKMNVKMLASDEKYKGREIEVESDAD